MRRHLLLLPLLLFVASWNPVTQIGGGVPAAAGGTDFTADENAQGCSLMFTDSTEASADDDQCTSDGSDDMTYTGTFATGASAPAGSGDMKSVELDGSTPEYFSLAHHTSFEASTFTYGCWINHDDAGSEAVMGKNDTPNYEMRTVSGSVWIGEVKDVPEAAATTIADATWYHMVQRYDADTDEVELFLYGSDDCAGGSCATQATAPEGNTQALFIGATQGGQIPFDGQIMECFYFDKALTDTEICEVFLCGMDGQADGDARDTAYGGCTCAAVECCG